LSFMFHCRYLEVARSYCTRTRDIVTFLIPPQQIYSMK
jgi:hypothetical protein